MVVRPTVTGGGAVVPVVNGHTGPVVAPPEFRAMICQ